MRGGYTNMVKCRIVSENYEGASNRQNKVQNEVL